MRESLVQSDGLEFEWFLTSCAIDIYPRYVLQSRVNNIQLRIIAFTLLVPQCLVQLLERNGG